jgi:hypothetical protein
MDINWGEYRQNWPGRLRWVETRVVEGRATDEELEELLRLLEARDDWKAQGFWLFDGYPSILHS